MLTKLPLGLTVSRDAFQFKLDTAYYGLPQVISIADDFIYVTWEDGSDHNANFMTFLKVTRQNGLKLNVIKIHHQTKEVKFFGLTFTADGHRPNDNKVKVVQGMMFLSILKKIQCFLRWLTT